MQDDAASLADRVAGRLERLGLDPQDAAKKGGLPADAVQRLLDGRASPPRGTPLRKLAEALECSVSYLVGLDPDSPVPPELLEDDQGNFGLLSADQEALLRAYNKLDFASKQAVLRVVAKMAGPEPEPVAKRR